MCVEPESTAEAEVASSAVPPAAAGVPLGTSGFSHTPRPSHPSLGLAEVSASLPQTARTWLRVRWLPGHYHQRWMNIIFLKVPSSSHSVWFTRLAAGGCIGQRFFQSSSQAALLRSLRQRIQEVSDFHHAASQALRVPPPQPLSSGSQADDSPDKTPSPYLTSPQLHTELVRWGEKHPVYTNAPSGVRQRRPLSRA